MKIIEENTTKSQRKLWSFVALVIFALYALVILFKHWPADIPTHIAYIIGVVVTYYFVKSGIREYKQLSTKIGITTKNGAKGDDGEEMQDKDSNQKNQE